MAEPCWGVSPLIAAEDLFQYALVKFVAGAGDVDEIELLDEAVATDFCWGIVQAFTPAGEDPSVETRPGLRSRAVAGAAFAAGAPLTAGAGALAGKVVAGVPGVDLIHALALEPAGALDEIVKVLTKFEIGL